MRRAMWIILLGFVAHGHAEGRGHAASDPEARSPQDKSADELVNKLFSRIRKASPLNDRDVNSAALGKPTHLGSPTPMSPSRRSLDMGRRSLDMGRLGAHPQSTLQDSPWAQASHTSHSHGMASNQPQFHSEATNGRRVRTSAYAIVHPHLHVEDVKLALTILRDSPRAWLSWYDTEAIKFPLTTKAATSGVCYSIGDFCAQGFAGKNLSTWDLARTARSGAAGFIAHGPMSHYWLNYLDKAMSFGGAWWAILPKIALDQGPMSAVENTLYSLLVGALALKDPQEVLKKVHEMFIPGFIASIRFWPAVQLVTFTMIPIELQVLWQDVAEIVWICVLSGVYNEGGIGHGD